MSLTTDRSLLDAFRKGQRSALERVYADHVDDVARFLRGGFVFESNGSTVRFRGVQSQFHLEDLLHDVFIRAFADRARTQYDGLRPYGPYLHRIARNLVIDELRRKEHDLRAYFEELPEPQEEAAYAPQDHESPEAQVERRQLQAHVASFVASLPEREAQVYRLRFVDGLEQRDVAAQAGISVSKVKTSERRIRRGFQDYLRSLGWLEGSTADAAELNEVHHA